MLCFCHLSLCSIAATPFAATPFLFDCCRVDDAAPGLSSKQSKQQAALRALRLLYAAGKLNDNLQAIWITQKHSRQLGE
jgi:hypothetical protein